MCAGCGYKREEWGRVIGAVGGVDSVGGVGMGGDTCVEVEGVEEGEKT